MKTAVNSGNKNTGNLMHSYNRNERGKSGGTNKKETKAETSGEEKRNKNSGKSTHIEDWENDPYTRDLNEKDVKGEFEIRSESKGGKRGRGNEPLDEEEQRWKLHSSGSDEYNSGNEYRKSGKGKDETLGVP